MDVTVAATNKTPVSSMRGAGYPQAAFAMERMMDRVARELKLDRAEVRRRNLIPAEKMPYTKPLKARSGAAMQYDSGDYPACQADGAEGRRLGRFPEAPGRGARAGPLSSASASRTASRAPAAGRSSPASCGSRNTGKVTVFTGAADLGQGLRTVLAQIAASELGLRVGGHHRGAGRHRRACRSGSAPSPAGRRSPPASRCCSRRARSPRRRRSSPAICWKPPSTISN